MPNHITNVLEINAYPHRGVPEGLIDQILETIRGEETAFDFNMIIPRPEDLDVTSGSVASNALALNDDHEATSMLLACGRCCASSMSNGTRKSRGARPWMI